MDRQSKELMEKLPGDFREQLYALGAEDGKTPEQVDEEMLAWSKIGNYHQERDKRYQEWRSIKLVELINMGHKFGKTSEEVEANLISKETPEFIELKKQELGPQMLKT